MCHIMELCRIDGSKQMNKKMAAFETVMDIAGIPVLIRSRYQANTDFFRDYHSDRTPEFTIEPTEDDLQRMRQAYFKMTGSLNTPEAVLENSAIHELLARKLLEYDVLLMHGSALSMDGEAYIFTAPSGTGKSTHARLWRETYKDRVWMIDDDKPLLRIGEEAVTVCGTPWNGKHHLGRNASAPLKAVIHLTRSEENHIEPVPAKEAFPIILQQSFSPHEPVLMAKVLELEKQLLNLVRCYKLSCNMLKESAEIAWNGINRGIPAYGGNDL